MELQEKIEKQFQEHRHFAASFKAAHGGDYYHPRTGKRITWSKMCFMIAEDAEKRTKKIMELCEQLKSQNP